MQRNHQMSGEIGTYNFCKSPPMQTSPVQLQEGLPTQLLGGLPIASLRAKSALISTLDNAAQLLAKRKNSTANNQVFSIDAIKVPASFKFNLFK